MNHRSSLFIFLIMTLTSVKSKAQETSDPITTKTPCTYCKGFVSKEDFFDIIKSVYKNYEKLVAEHGLTLRIDPLWNDNRLTAEVSQMAGPLSITLSGGWARHPVMTKDAYTLIVCHELGHFFGGFPFNKSTRSEQRDAEDDARGERNPDTGNSNEGQSDYFATQDCAKRLWRDQMALNASIRNVIPHTAQSKCDSVYTDSSDQDLCYRILLASKNLTDAFANVIGSSLTSFDENDTQQVEQTLHGHPNLQCRLDTFMAGAFCNVPRNHSVIPGRKGGSTRNNEEAEREAATQSCTEFGGHTKGLRPRCWFKPSL